MKTAIVAGIGVLFLVFSPSQLFAQPKVGVLASYSGDWGSYGVAYRNGIELAGVGDSVTFVYEDDGFIPAKTVTAFRKLVDVDKITAVLVGDTVTGQAIAPLAKNKRIPLYAWASTGDVFADNPYVTRLWTKERKDYGFIVAQVVRRGYRRVALFTSTHPYSNGWADAIAARLKGSSVEDFSTAPEGFQTQLLKLKQGGFDAVGICLNTGLNGLFARQMRELKISLPLFSCDFVEATPDIDAAKGAFDGVWFTAPRISKSFAQTYKNRFGKSDHIVSAAIFHDAALLVTGTTQKPFAIDGLKVIDENGDRHLDFEYGVFQFRGATIEELNP